MIIDASTVATFSSGKKTLSIKRVTYHLEMDILSLSATIQNQLELDTHLFPSVIFCRLRTVEI